MFKSKKTHDFARQGMKSIYCLPRSRSAAMEMSVGTIVTIVLLMALLVLGLFFIKNIMCSGIILTDQVNEKVTNQIKGLFGENDYGVKCMGEEGQEIKLGDGGRRQITCVINEKEEKEYRFKMVSIESLKGVSTANVKKWVLKDDTGNIKIQPGSKAYLVILLDIPEKVTDTSLSIDIEQENIETGAIESHPLVIDVVHVGGVSAAIC